MAGVIEKIFITLVSGAELQPAGQVEAIGGEVLRGDRYGQHSGYWTGTDRCEVTLIQVEDLEAITASMDFQILNGEHRRNSVTRGFRLENLAGKRFQIGEAVLEYDRPQPTCGYIQSPTLPGMTRALLGCGRIGTLETQSGMIRVKDSLAPL